MTKRWRGAPVVLLLAGCASQVRTPPAAPPATASGSVQELAAAIDADAKRSDHEADSKVRGQLASQAQQLADACMARAPHAAPCLYGQGVALGLAARAHPTRAGELLTAMLASLAGAEAVEPGYDQAGPARVRALVLIRAPGWPLGPGDAEAGLTAARRAVELRPEYPPNQLALGEALAKNGDANGARSAYARARDQSKAMPDAPDRDDWLRQADAALDHAAP